MGWIFANLILPLLAPSALLLLLRLIPVPHKVTARLALIIPVKDGQLCYLAMAFCCAALYEVQDFGWASAFLIGLLVVSSLLASGGALFHTAARVQRGVAWYVHFRCLLASLVLVLIAAIFYGLVHFRLI